MLEDRELTAPAAKHERARKSVTLLIGGDGAALIGQLEAALEGKVRVLRRADAATVPQLTAESIAALTHQIEEAPGERVLLVADREEIQVYPYH
jgi:hypothetical protein